MSRAYEACMYCLICNTPTDVFKDKVSFPWDATHETFSCAMCRFCKPAYARWRAANPNDQARGRFWWDAADGVVYYTERYYSQEDADARAEWKKLNAMA